MDRAKELFFQYNGSHFHMDREGDGKEYAGYHISRETEEKWAEEFILGFLASEASGKEALRGYAAAAELLRYRERDEVWDRCLTYPLRAGHLDDVSILFMLPHSFRLAERAVKKGCFSREDAGGCLQELDGYIAQVRERADKGALTRHPDYVLREFSDPVYISSYLDELRKKWLALC